MIEVDSIRKRFYGQGAQDHYGLGRKLLGILQSNMKLGGLDQAVMRKWIDGVYFEVSSVFGHNEIRIFKAGGQEYVVQGVEAHVGMIETTHILWGNMFPASIAGWFGFPGPPEDFFPDQKAGLLEGLDGAVKTMAFNNTLDYLRFSIVSPATYILGSFDRNVYAYFLSLNEFTRGNYEFGSPPFKSVDIERWHEDGRRVEVIKTGEIFPNVTHPWSTDFMKGVTFEFGYGFLSSYFNRIRVGQFIGDMYNMYFRTQGNPANANFTDEAMLPAQQRFLVMDTYAGMFTEDAPPIVQPFQPEVVPTTFEGLYGQTLIDIISEFHKEVYSYWYVSQVPFVPETGQRVMRVPSEIEGFTEHARAYEQNTYNADSEFNTVPRASQRELLRTIGVQLSKDIKSKVIERMITAQGAPYGEREIQTYQPGKQ